MLQVDIVVLTVILDGHAEFDLMGLESLFNVEICEVQLLAKNDHASAANSKKDWPVGLEVFVASRDFYAVKTPLLDVVWLTVSKGRYPSVLRAIAFKDHHCRVFVAIV